VPLGCSAAFSPLRSFRRFFHDDGGKLQYTGDYVLAVIGEHGTLPQATAPFALTVANRRRRLEPAATLDQFQPGCAGRGQPLTITGTLQGLAPGNSGVGRFRLTTSSSALRRLECLAWHRPCFGLQAHMKWSELHKYRPGR